MEVEAIDNEPILPILSDNLRNRILNSISIKSSSDKLNLINIYRSQFPIYVSQLRAGFNLCFYGVGSKQALLEEFVFSYMSKCHICIFNGTSLSISLRKILNVIFTNILKEPLSANIISNTTSITTGFQSAFKKLDKLKVPICILLHNIDTSALRSNYSVLSTLASHPKINFICSIDDINASRLWDESIKSRFKFLFHEATTFLSYSEISTVKNSKVHSLDEISYILSSLTKNHKDALYLLDRPMRLEEWYDACINEMIVANESVFGTYIQEMKDHELITCKSGIYELNCKRELLK